MSTSSSLFLCHTERRNCQRGEQGQQLTNRKDGREMEGIELRILWINQLAGGAARRDETWIHQVTRKPDHHRRLVFSFACLVSLCWKWREKDDEGIEESCTETQTRRLLLRLLLAVGVPNPTRCSMQMFTHAHTRRQTELTRTKRRRRPSRLTPVFILQGQVYVNDVNV